MVSGHRMQEPPKPYSIKHTNVHEQSIQAIKNKNNTIK